MRREGTLPRGCSLHKSLLVDCVGPKFEELLLAFSTVVLQRVTRKGVRSKSMSTGIATSEEVNDQDLSQIPTLALVLSIDLQHNLQTRKIHQSRYQELFNQFAIREEYFKLLERCNRSSLAEYRKQILDQDIDYEVLKRKLHSNVQGEWTWLGVAMSGELHADRDMLAESSSFDTVWRRAKAGLAPEIDTKDQETLILATEKLSNNQECRLRRWKDFQSRVSQRNGDLIITRSPTNSPKKTPRTLSQTSPKKSAYQNLSEAQHTFITRGGHKKSLSISGPIETRSTSGGRLQTENAIQEVSRQLEWGATHAKLQKDDESVIGYPPEGNKSTTGGNRENGQKGSFVSKELIQNPGDKSGEGTTMAVESPLLSLAQRTRNSMAFGIRNQPNASGRIEYSKTSAKNDAPCTPTQDSLEEETSQLSLAERTQRSMACMHQDSEVKKPARTTSHRKSKSVQLSRKPAFPVNPFSTEQMGGMIGSNTEYEHKNVQVSRGTPPHIHDPRDAPNAFKPSRKLRRSPPTTSPVSVASLRRE